MMRHREEQDPTSPTASQSTGIAGLDEILGGGLTVNRLYLAVMDEE